MQLRSILGNFAFSNMNVKEIEAQIQKEFPNKDKEKDLFYYEEVISMITK